MKSQEHKAIRQYLLDLTQHEEQPSVEERLLTDSAFYEELLIAEDELIDEYLAGELSPSEQRNFEGHFPVTAERQQKLRFARALQRYVAESPSRKSSGVPTPKWWHPSIFLSFKNPVASVSLAVAILLLVVGVSRVAVMNWRPQKPRGAAVIVVLTPGLVREGGEIKKISISPDTDAVQLRLALTANEHQSYRVVLLTSQGANVWTGTNLRAEQVAEGKFIVLNLPANILSREDYQAKVSGQADFEDVASYTFRVSR